jgi:surface antigen Omp85-like protein
MPPDQRFVRFVAPLAFLTLALPALGQTPPTRAETLRQQREEKAKSAAPYEPSGLEKALTIAEDKAVVLLGREGFYPKLGSLTTGSGFAFGAGFRNRPVFKHYGTLDLWAAGSLRKYWAVETRATFPDLANGHLFAEAWATRRDYPQEDFFGIGPEASRSEQVNFAFRRTIIGARGGVRPLRRLLVGGGVQYVQPNLGPGQDTRVPSIEALFNEATAPGLDQQPNYLLTSGLVELDYRQPINARKGGWYLIEFIRYHDRDRDTYSFNRLDVDLRQYVPFLAERRVLAGRAYISTSEAQAGHTVPFYFMPYLGGRDTLRGFREYRFRGPHALLLQGEYRYEIWSGLEGALFYDAGKVAVERADLNLKNLEKDYGFGFRFNTDNGVVVRVDAGFGSKDGKHLYITFGGVF